MIHRPLLVVSGVSGTGKTTVGQALAGRLGVIFEDADDLHPPANRAKMTRGEPLTDADREPWLELVGQWLAQHEADGGVMACSALRRTYRDLLRAHAPGLSVLLLQGDPALIARRQSAREGHFMPTSLLPSQLATLEALGADERGAVIDVAASVAEVVEACLRFLTGQSSRE